MNKTPLIHLKSFNRKEDALLWLGKNYIEGAFIELGSSIKSIDSYGVSGKFNVVVEYEDLIKGVESLKSIFKSPIQNIVDRYGGAQGPESEGWVRQPGKTFAGNGAPLISGGRFPSAATNITNMNLARLLGRATQGGNTPPAQVPVPERLPRGVGVAPSVPMGPNTGAGTPNAFDLFRERSKTPTRNPGSSTSNAFDQYGESSAARNSGMGAWATGTSGRNPTGSSTLQGTSGVPTLELVRETPNQTGSIPEGTKNTPAQEENERKRGAGIWSRLGRALLPAAVAIPLILGGHTGYETPINFPKERGHTIEILKPDTPGTQKPPVAQRTNLFDTPTTEKPPTEKPPTAATMPDKNVVEKAVYMVIKSLIERGVIA
jgi:hypothetical protein